MVKLGVRNKKGKPVIILGLSELNIERLKEGTQIVIDLEPYDMVGQAVIMYGRTEEAITQELSKVFHIPQGESN